MRVTLLLAPSVAAWVLSACGETPPPPAPAECTQAQAAITNPMPGFCLYDTNSTSPTADEAVSPRNLLGAISAWYFTTAT